MPERLRICCLVGLPVGIWSLIVLGNPKVQDAFSDEA